MKKYLIFDLDGTLIKSNKSTEQLIINFLVKRFNLDVEKFSYFLQQTRGFALKEQLIDFLNLDEKQAEKLALEIYELIEEEDKSQFFSGAQDKIKELSKKYTLFLSTGNSTEFAREKLEKGGILKEFLYVLGSEKLEKGIDHIEFFKTKVGDKDFEKDAVFIGDGQNDRETAKTSNIDFVHIDQNLKNLFDDKYEISSVSEIDKVLSLLNEK